MPVKPDSIARRKRKRRPKAMDLRTLSKVLTEAIVALEDHLEAITKPEKVDGEELRKTAHALATVSGSYVKTLEQSDLSARLEELEARFAPIAKRK